MKQPAEGLYTPTQLILKTFQHTRILLLAEDHAVKNNLDFVRGMIPDLYENGIKNLGMEFGCQEDQYLLNQLVSSDHYNQVMARNLMFHYNVRWPYQEYMDFYQAAWEFNQTLTKGQQPFRIINLSYAYNWEGFDGNRTPSAAAKIFHKGNTEAFRAKVVEDLLKESSEKILILTGTVHAYTRYHYPFYDGNGDRFVRHELNGLGNRLYRLYGQEAKTILLHQPSQDKMTGSHSNEWGEKFFEQLYRDHGDAYGIDFSEHRLGEALDPSYLSSGYDHLRFRDIADGYILLKPLGELHGATLVEDFIDDKSFDDVLRNYPDPDWAMPPVNKADYYRIAGDYVDLKKRYGFV